jgi:hypothetical protein
MDRTSFVLALFAHQHANFIVQNASLVLQNYPCWCNKTTPAGVTKLPLLA